VDVDFFTPAADDASAARDCYFSASRWVPYKRVDLVVAAFRGLPERRLVVAGDGTDARRVRAAAGGNVEFVGEVPRERLRDLLRHARAFVFAAEEDFGILPLEAQACGTPVIAYGRGGALETVRGIGSARPTGSFFAEQSADAIAEAIRSGDAVLDSIDPMDCRRNAERFSASRFRTAFKRLVDESWADFTAGRQ
jgi:glycosyltransferase involved in cell wall biosynthesis